MTGLQTITEMARVAWNEAAPRHRRSNYDHLVQAVRSPDYSFLDDHLTNELRRRGIKDADVVQFNCNNGRELISAKRLGANRCVGIDYSDEFIRDARSLNAAAGLNCEFLHSDVYQTPDNLNTSFDIVFLTAGAVCFMPDLQKYFATARRLLRPGGSVIVYESHPILEMFKLDRDRKTSCLTMEYSYFDTAPKEHRTGLDYYSNETYDAPPVYYFHHKMSDIIMSVINNNFIVKFFEEYPHDNCYGYRMIEREAARPPMSFILTAEC